MPSVTIYLDSKLYAKVYKDPSKIIQMALKLYFGGDNVKMWGPMSWTIIFGLTFATFLTLVIVPIMFYLSTRLKYKFFLK